jgi:hypothetical protein
MIHAAESFSHVVKAVKHDDHTLVTRGVYAYVPRLDPPQVSSSYVTGTLDTPHTAVSSIGQS